MADYNSFIKLKYSKNPELSKSAVRSLSPKIFSPPKDGMKENFSQFLSKGAADRISTMTRSPGSS